MTTNYELLKQMHLGELDPTARCFFETKIDCLVEIFKEYVACLSSISHLENYIYCKTMSDDVYFISGEQEKDKRSLEIMRARLSELHKMHSDVETFH